MDTLTVLVVLVVISALYFDFTNGWNDSANAIATVVATRVLTPGKAILLAAVLNFVGAMVGQAVAQTIAYKIIEPDAYDQLAPYVAQILVLAAVISAALWVTIVTRLGMPVSGSHSLIGGLIGAGLAMGGAGAISAEGLQKVILALLFSPIFGLLLGYLLMLGIIWGFRRMTMSRGEAVFGKLQLLSVSFMAFEHGQNDAQKAMGVITLALFAAKVQAGKGIQLWVVIVCGLAMALGTAAGGWRVMKTVGGGLMKLRPVQGFAAETSASLVLAANAYMGLPVSTTHTITSSIMGAGATQRLSAVRWGVGKKIVAAWVFTFPATIGVSWLLYNILNWFFK